MSEDTVENFVANYTVVEAQFLFCQLDNIAVLKKIKKIFFVIYCLFF